MPREGEPQPIQEDLFPETAKAKPEKNIAEVIAVDRNRPSATIAVEGFELTFVIWKGRIEPSLIIGATSADEIPEQYFNAAKRRATAILREIEAEGKKPGSS